MPSPESNGEHLLATVTRSGAVESRHSGSLAVFSGGEPCQALGDVEQPIFCRSAVKPLQALPTLERGLHERLQLNDGEIAVLTASHNGTAAHVAAVRSFLHKAGLDEELLGCGPHAPFDQPTRQRMLAAGEKPLRIHNNCSGKHTGFLCLARELGDDLADYRAPESRTQSLVRQTVAEMAGLDPAALGVGMDGCGAPTLRMPLSGLARAFCRLANPEGHGDVRLRACHRLFQATGRQPELLAGEGRLCTALVRSRPGRILPKNGAEGVYAIALPPDPERRVGFRGAVGIAMKVADGADRGYWPVAVDLLRSLGFWREGAVPEELADFHRVPVRNTRREQVGEVTCAVDFGEEL